MGGSGPFISMLGAFSRARRPLQPWRPRPRVPGRRPRDGSRPLDRQLPLAVRMGRATGSACELAGAWATAFERRVFDTPLPGARSGARGAAISRTCPCRIDGRTTASEGGDMKQHAVTMLGTGLIADFYTMTLHGQRNRDRVRVAYSRSAEPGAAFSERHGTPEHTTDMAAAIRQPETDLVVIGLPTFLHEEAVYEVAAAGEAHLITKPC